MMENYGISMNKILVIMPVYNTEPYVDNAIQSVLQQSHDNFHLVIIDDGSTDGSLDVIKQYENNDRVTILENGENKGCYYSRNRGLALLDDSYDFFTIHDSDDVSDVERFELIMNHFRHNPTLLGLKTTYIRVDTNYQPIEPHDIYSSEGIAVYRKKAFDILGFYDNTKFGGDTDYLWRLEQYCRLNPTYKVGTSEEVLYLAVLRNDGTNLTKKYNIAIDRQPYMRKLRQEISQMNDPQDFYREQFK